MLLVFVSSWDYALCSGYYNKSLTDQACSVNMAGIYWPHYSIGVDGLQLHKRKKELGQYPAILTLQLVNNPYLLYGKANPSVLIGHFLVGILSYGPFPWKQS